MANEEWKSFMLDLTPEELFGVTSVTKFDSKGDPTLEQIAAKSLSLPPIDFEHDIYVAAMSDFVEHLVKTPSSYTQERYRTIGSPPLVFGAGDLLHYLVSLQAAHKATQGINDKKRLMVLSSYFAWNELARTVNGDDFFHEVYKNLTDKRRNTYKRFQDYSPLFDLDELRTLKTAEGLPQQARERFWDEAAEIITKKSVANLGGGSGNSIIPVIYSVGKSLPAELIGTLDANDRTMIPDSTLAPDDPKYLSPREYVLVQLRQNTKGMSSSPHVL